MLLKRSIISIDKGTKIPKVCNLKCDTDIYFVIKVTFFHREVMKMKVLQIINTLLLL